MKRVLSLILVFCMVLGSVPAAADFAPVRDYPGFEDIPSDHWGYNYVYQCSTLGLMVGTSEKEFSPSGTLTVAQAITAVARVADQYRGGDGAIDQSGERWYDGAVEMALDMDIITKNEFDSYDRSATRSELAGLLARAMPKSEYAAINDISALPDVDKSTPYYKEILTLYKAGIVTGSDKYGTFYPDRDISRVELSAILCRLVLPETRMKVTLLDKSDDPTIYSTDKLLYIDGAPVPGIVEIGGKHYIPLEAMGSRINGQENAFSLMEYDEAYDVYLNYHRNDTTVVDMVTRPKAGVVLGQGEISAKPANIGGKYLSGKDLWTLGGSYPMASLEAMGAKLKNGDYYLSTSSADRQLTREYDLVGAIVPSLQRSTPAETVKALHDYLVGAINYDPRVYNVSGGYEHLDELSAAAWEKYTLENNYTLEFGYGVCQNYADIFHYMCLLSNIPCRMVYGYAGGSHAWNQVYIDGKWQYVDCTWDDPVGYNIIDHDYFLIDADELAQDHCWNGGDYPLPDEYDPAWEELDPMNITSRDMFRKCLIAQMRMGVNPVKLRVTKSGAYGGTGCIYNEYCWWWRFYGGYSNGLYIYHWE